mmetsp:Transcript_23156/g.39191  ORF Transcript_23156/g.39191 Transcript_23156/m.39191 type:complete len:91 (+) Transcript_23156:65-337(+)
MDVDLEQVPSQTGTATVDINNGKILKLTGSLTGERGEIQCMKLYHILLDSAKCIGDEHLKRISVSFDSHKFILTTAKSHVYIVKIPSDDN